LITIRPRRKKLASELGGSASALEPGTPFGGEVVVLALYYPGIKDAAREYGDRLAGKVVVDISNPVDTQTWDRLATAPGTSAAEEVAEIVPEGSPVVKAFNTTFAGTLVAGEAAGQQLDVLIAGDDAGAKQKGRAARLRRRSAAHRRRPSRARTAARAARVPAHLTPAAVRARLRERDQAASVG
jgi:predicted dinucleotide-binding enzyme